MDSQTTGKGNMFEPTSKEKILVIDDDVGILTVLKTLLRRQGYEILTQDNGNDVLRVIAEEHVDLILTDLVMPGMDGLAVLGVVVQNNPEIPVIIMTGHAGVESAIDAMRLGAFDYISKPFDMEELLAVVRRALPFSNLDNNDLSRSVDLNHGMVGESVRMRQLYELIRETQHMEEPLCILGEAGTGKGLVARALHLSGPFVEIDCLEAPPNMIYDEFFGMSYSATRPLPDDDAIQKQRLPVQGCLEKAHGGTLYLNEIGCLPHAVQHDLVRVVQTGILQRDRIGVPTAFRILISSTEPLERKLQRGELLEELYYGLGVATIEVPPLRNRAGDIPLLTQHTLHAFNMDREQRISIDMKSMAALEAYSWPGNVRELVGSIRRAANRAALQDGCIRLEHLPHPVRNCFVRLEADGKSYSDEYDLRWRSLRKFLREKELEFVRHTLRSVDGDRQQAAASMGISSAEFERKYGANL